MSYVIRNDKPGERGAYLQVWFNGTGEATRITRVELVPKAEASSWRTRSEAKREILDKYPGSNFTVEVR